MRMLVCDDNRDELNIITSMLMECKYKEGCSLKSFHEPWNVIDYFEDGFKADAIFLDIIMPEINGIDLAKKLRSFGFKDFIVFLSASNDFAAQSYKVKAFYYLLKPLKKHEVQSVIDKIEMTRSVAKRSGINLTSRGNRRFVAFAELVYVEVQNHHVYFHLRDGEVLRIYGRLSDYAKILLADPRMTHENRSFILNMDYIDRCECGAVFLMDGTRISIPQGFNQFQSNYFNWMFRKKEYFL